MTLPARPYTPARVPGYIPATPPRRPRMNNPHIRVFVGDDVQEFYAYNRHMVEYERLSARDPNKWPVFHESPMIWLNFLAFHRLKDDDNLPAGVTRFEEFVAAVDEVSPIPDDEGGATKEVDPTPTDHEDE
jgi:hypothetical protein